MASERRRMDEVYAEPCRSRMVNFAGMSAEGSESRPNQGQLCGNQLDAGGVRAELACRSNALRRRDAPTSPLRRAKSLHKGQAHEGASTTKCSPLLRMWVCVLLASLCARRNVQGMMIDCPFVATKWALSTTNIQSFIFFAQTSFAKPTKIARLSPRLPIPSNRSCSSEL